MYTFARIVTGIARIIIRLVKFTLKILLIPVIIGLTLLEWICTIAVGFFKHIQRTNGSKRMTGLSGIRISFL